MASPYPNQDRYIVISLPTTSRKAIHSARWSFAGDAIAFTNFCLNPHSGCFFIILQSARSNDRASHQTKIVLRTAQVPGLGNRRRD
jgi:hypothetical protein